MSQQNFNNVDSTNLGEPIFRPQYMVGSDRSGERGGPVRGGLKPPDLKPTNVNDPSKRKALS